MSACVCVCGLREKESNKWCSNLQTAKGFLWQSFPLPSFDYATKYKFPLNMSKLLLEEKHVTDYLNFHNRKRFWNNENVEVT